MDKLQKNYKVIDFPPLTEEQKSMLDNLPEKTDLDICTSDISEAVGNGVFYYTKNNFTPKRVTKLRKNIDLSDIPEITDFSQGHLRNWKPQKKSITIRIDLDNLSWLQSDGVKGYQTKLNEVLRWARENKCPVLQK